MVRGLVGACASVLVALVAGVVAFVAVQAVGESAIERLGGL